MAILDKEILSYTNTQANLISLLDPKYRGIDTDQTKNWSYVDASGDFHVTANQKKWTGAAWVYESPSFLNVTAFGTVFVADNIEHEGDSDTYFTFSPGGDEILAMVGGVSLMKLNTGLITFNDDSGDVDFRVEGDGDENLFYTNAGTDMVGVGTNDPDTKLEVFKAGTQLKLSFDATDNCTFAVDTDGDLTVTPSNGASAGSMIVKLGDTANVETFKVADSGGGTGATIGSAGNSYFAGAMGIGEASPSTKLEVLSTSAQLTLSYSNGVDAIFAVGSGGDLTITPSGSNIIIPANKDVRTAAWADYSGTSTVVGWSSYTTKLIYYKKVGNLVFVSYHIAGTSNSVGVNFTLPYADGNTVPFISPVSGQDNTTTLTAPAQAVMSGGSSMLNIGKVWGTSSGGWTASGTKVVQGQFWFEAA